MIEQGELNKRVVTYKLTARQLQVAILLSSGNAFKQVAEVMQVEVRTVVHHAEKLREKMGTPNTLSAVVKLLS